MSGQKGRSGRKRKPTELHKQDGTYQKCRHEDRADNAPAAGWPEKPAGLTKLQDGLWERVVNFLPPECLGSLDTDSLRDMVRLYGVYVDLLSQVEQDPTDDKTLNSCLKVWNCFWKYAQHYGLTPVARASLQIPKKGDSGSPMEALSKLLESRN